MIHQRPRAFVFINGIFTMPWRKSWNEKAVEFVTKNLPDCKAVKYQYYSDAIFVGWRQREIAMELMGIVNRLEREGYEVVLVGHSNGCAIISYIVNEMDEDVGNLHLIAPAAYACDFDLAINRGNTSGVFIYGSRHDIPLTVLAPISRLLTLGLSGYGSLGAHARDLELRHPGMAFDYSNNTYGHSSWFDDDKFDDTMRLIMVNEGLMLVGNQTPV